MSAERDEPATADSLDALPLEYVIRDSSGAVLDRWVESDESPDDDPCCEECVAWRPGDDTHRIQAMQDDINAAFERLKAASISYSLQRGLFVIRKDEE